MLCGAHTEPVFLNVPWFLAPIDFLKILALFCCVVMCYNVWNRIFAENAPKILKKIRQNINVRVLLNRI
jgi:hypothetical protein